MFNYLTRVELEVERNVLELRALMPDATETDRFFYEDVWSPQELQHGILLDAVQQGFGMTPAPTDLSSVSTKIRVVGTLSHLPGMLGVVRLLYYLTGAATERSAVIAYSRLLDGLRAMGEPAIAETVIAPIRRQEPGHFAFYRMSAEALVRRRGAERLAAPPRADPAPAVVRGRRREQSLGSEPTSVTSLRHSTSIGTSSRSHDR